MDFDESLHHSALFMSGTFLPQKKAPSFTLFLESWGKPSYCAGG